MKKLPLTPIAICLLAIAIISGSLIIARSIPEHERPEILIIREHMGMGFDGHIMMLDYSVGGIATNETFHPHEMDLYRSVIAHLKRSGRLRYASPMIEPMGGD